MPRKLKVFLCHSSDDKAPVREIYARLKSESWIAPWLDEEELYPGQKIIIWAHNTHVQKDLEAVTILANDRYQTNMGNWLYQTYPDAIYSIGSLAYRGYINYGLVQNIYITENECIEAILYQARKKYFFVDFSQQIEVTGNSWMFHPVTQTYIHLTKPCDIQYIPREQYDGILFWEGR